MSMAESLGPHLPYLRRYARALTGSQKSGDAYVRASLEALVEGDQSLEQDLPPRVALYRLFHAIWISANDDSQPTPSELEESPEDRLMSLAPRSRQALLLTSMEGFTTRETARILDVEEAEVDRMIAKAQAEIEAELATNVLIIEDEPVIAMDIEGLVSELGHNITAITTTRDEAVQAAKDNPPGLVLADIQLADGSSGVDAVKAILGDMDVPVIFITAYPERLLTGERPEPAFLITKPFLPQTVKAAIGQALFFHPRRRDKAA
ncbi:MULTISPECIES: response regulator [Euryhalocaulis]|uniref:response regulator n=1 Tax=Euryhalocaulis TaxID=1712422 RepID=UPI00039BF5BD|nr:MULTISPECIES: response regulator [Euryhalocaulis]MBA4801291.1 response regulator [Euryhalocaulis sp.]